MIREYENLKEFLEEQDAPVDEVFDDFPLMANWSDCWKNIVAIDENKALKTGYKINYDDEYGFLLYSSLSIVMRTAYFLNRNCIICRHKNSGGDDYFVLFLKKNGQTKNTILEALRETK